MFGFKGKYNIKNRSYFQKVKLKESLEIILKNIGY